MAKKLSKFGAEFAKQRAAGAKEFSFGGKQYNTKLAGEGSKKSSSKAPSKGPALGPSRAEAIKSMSKQSSYSSLSQIGKEGVKSVKSATPTKPYMKDTSTLNDFKQKEARRSSDEKTGKANRPKVKKAIGKFFLGKGYKG